MRRELSSRITFFHQIIVPVAFVGGAGIMLWQLNSIVTAGSESIFAFLFAILLPTTFLGLAWYSSRAKRVWLENDDLIVSGLSEETRFPLKNIDKVTATRFTNPEQVRIYFRSSAGASTNIFFYPPIRWFQFWSHHPVAEEIRKLAHNAASPDTPYTEQRTPTDWKRVIVGAASIAIFVIVLFGFIFAVMKSSKPYQWSLSQVQSNPEIAHRLGSPIEPGWFISGSMTTGGDSESAFLTYSVRGPKGKGNVIINGKTANGVWVYERAVITIEDDYVSLLDNSDRS